MTTRIQGVYSITHSASGRVYVGSSRDIIRRWNYHRNRLKRGTHDNGYLQRAWAKYGENAFEWCIEEIVERHEDLLNREQHFIENLKATSRPRGFNIRTQANGYALSEETKRKISAKARGRKRSKPHTPFSYKLTPDDYRAIKYRLAAWESLRSIADDFGVGMTTILRIAQRRGAWNVQLDPETEARIDARPKHPKRQCSNYRVNEDLVREIRRRLAAGETTSHIADALGLKYPTVYAVKRGTTWSYVV